MTVKVVEQYAQGVLLVISVVRAGPMSVPRL
jgi:hypothetical protein